MPKRLYIVDSHSHLYASFYAIGNLRAPDGEPTGATYGFTQAVVKILREQQPDYMVAVYDAPEETFRVAAYADYKATREAMPDDLVPQIDRSKEVLAALGVTTLAAPGYEADDLVATFATQARENGCEVVIVSRDKDLYQLLGPGVVMYDTRSDRILDADWLRSEKGIEPGQVIDMLALMGDTVDNIPGVPGIGEKRAVALLQKYGSLDNLLQHADEVKGKMGESLRANVEQARLSHELATLKHDVPVDVSYKDLALGDEDRPRLAALFRQLAFKRLAEEYEAAGGGAAVAKKAAEKDFRCVRTAAELKRLGADLKKTKAFAFDTEATGLDPLVDKMVGVSFSTGEGVGWYVPALAPQGEKTFTVDEVKKALGPALGNAKSLKVSHNAKFDLAVLRTAGIEVADPVFDTMIASYLLAPSERSHGLDSLAQDVLGYRTVHLTELIGEKKRGNVQKAIDEVPLDEMAFYSAEDSEVAWRLYEAFEPHLKEAGLDDLFRTVEMPLVRVLEDMERTGVALDVDLLAKMSKKIGRRLEELRAEIHKEAGHEFNVDSPRQLETVLFDELGMAPVRKTKTGRSTDAATLEVLAGQHPVAAKVLEYRTLAKLKGTYVDALPELVNSETGRVHASFNQAVTATGRLSSSNPNLQNIPIREEQGREIRAAFVPGDPKRDVLLTADYSQVELRLLAHFSQDPFLVEAFQKDLDIHAFVASEIFGVPQSKVTSEQRGRAKTINFSLIYGKSAYGLSQDLRISVGEAAEFIKAYFARYTRVRQFMVDVLTGAKNEGQVTTILGRRRATPGIRFTDATRWTNAERAAFNTVLQGSAADLIKVAMNRIARRIREEGRPSKMILQVHDELVFETPKKAVEAEKKMIVEEMVGALELKVPMKVDVAWGPNWREAK